MTEVGLAELFRAGRRVFHHEWVPSATFLNDLDRDRLRRAFHQRARATHPDRAASLGRDSAVLEAEFRALSKAFVLLRDFLDSDRVLAGPLPRQASVRRKPTARVRPRRDPSDVPPPWRRAATERSLPERSLRLGEYLYYGRFIDFSDLARALAWQRQARPRVGEIARGWRYLDDAAVQRILTARRCGERFVACAQRLGLLNGYQRMALLGRQRQLQPRLGQWFITAGVLDPPGLIRCEVAKRAHNRRLALKR